ncbi:MAG: methyltransferase domain-containing protein [Winogradskyella sp.]
MTEAAITSIYNKLFKWEGKSAKAPYPIHKKLNTVAFGYDDIYKWILYNYQFNSDSKVLDAGCGVGYGSLLIAETKQCQVKGISLSDAEILQATQFSKEKNLEHLVTFKVKSYDTLEPNTFDFIIATESVKHSLNLKMTLKSLINALKPNGTLIIVDDFLTNETYSNSIKSYQKDWQLAELLTASDVLPPFRLKKDLTDFVQTKSNLKLHLSIILLSVLKQINSVATIMRGGLYLEKLFNEGVMKYYIIDFKKPNQ